MRERLDTFWKNETVLCAAAVAAAASAFLTPPSADYFAYIDFRVLGLLFCLMMVVSAMRRIGVFEVLANRILNRASTMLGLGSALVFLCFFFAMAVTNDVALITFVPFTVRVLELAERQDKLIPVVVLQTVAANLGSMLTPVGNPQNLYLYSAFEMNMDRFLDVTTPVTTFSAGLLALACFLMLDRKKTAREAVWRPENLAAEAVWRQKTLAAEEMRSCGVSGSEEAGSGKSAGLEAGEKGITAADRGRLLLYMGLFVLCLLTVLRVLPWQALVITVALCAFFADRQLFFTVDYGLLVTFGCFFIFVGNLSAAPQVSAPLSELLAGREILVSAAVSQVISNVPAAVLLSGFTAEGDALLLGVNLGGLGTLIASLASLISYKLYAQCGMARKGRYLAVFTAVNLIFLIALLAFVFLFQI